MSVKSDVLRALEERRGSFFSGEQLAEELGVSRAAVWKSVKQLEKEGYEIVAVQNKGYCLPEHTDILSGEGIRAHLPKEYADLDVQVFEKTDSTNRLAKQAAAAGQPGRLLFVADSQTAGRGRRGRSFVSVPGGMICMSLLLRPKLFANEAVLLTVASCVAVHRAIRKRTGIIADIKWVNDLYYNGKKICGILTEAVTDCETGGVDSVVIGIGVNFNIAPEQFPEELRDIAGALYAGEKSTPVTRNELAAQIAAELLDLEEGLKEKRFLAEYREHSMLLGKPIWILSQGEPEEAVAVGIDENGGLIVERPDGTTGVLSTGEVSVRVKSS